MLLPSTRYTKRDAELWADAERFDAYVADDKRWPEREAKAIAAIREFVAEGPCYVGVSWGKDSVVTAHLARQVDPAIPLVWIRREPIDNPDCHLVRDAFVAMFPGANAKEVLVECERDPAHPQQWWTKGVPGRGIQAQPKQVGFARAHSLFGDRYISGVRAAESGARKLRMMHFGVATENACAPIGWWSTELVFAYLYRHNLPVHPAYACVHHGTFSRDRLRVGGIGGPHGRGHGRAEWERLYYNEQFQLSS